MSSRVEHQGAPNSLSSTRAQQRRRADEALARRVLQTLPPLERGDSGAFVRALVQQLKNQGFWSEPAMPARFDRRTERAVTAYQRQRALDVDGRVGQQTWAALLELHPQAPGNQLLAPRGTQPKQTRRARPPRNPDAEALSAAKRNLTALTRQKLPPDTRSFLLDPSERQPGVVLEQLTALKGPADAKRFEALVDSVKPQLEQLERVVRGGPPFVRGEDGAPRLGAASYLPMALASIARSKAFEGKPVTFSVNVMTAQKRLGPLNQMYAPGGHELLIGVETPGQPPRFFRVKDAFLQRSLMGGFVAQPAYARTLETLAASPKLARAWFTHYEQLRPGEATNAKAALAAIDPKDSRALQWVMAAVLSMRPAQQAELAEHVHARTPPSEREGAGEDTFEALTTPVEVDPDSHLVANAAANHVAFGTPVERTYQPASKARSSGVPVTVNLAGAKLSKGYHFISDDAHIDTVFQPQYLAFRRKHTAEPKPYEGREALLQEMARESGMTVDPKTGALSEEDEKLLGPIADELVRLGQGKPRVGIVPVFYLSPESDQPIPMPLFRVLTTRPLDFQRKSGLVERFVDAEGRVYDSFDDWRRNNVLPPGKMVFPKGGRLSGGGKVALEWGNTPKTIDSTRERILGGIDRWTGKLILPALLIAPIPGIGIPAAIAFSVIFGWAGARAIGRQADRQRHGQSLSLLDPAARQDWFRIAEAVPMVGLAPFLVSGLRTMKLARGAGPSRTRRFIHTRAARTDATSRLGRLTVSLAKRVEGHLKDAEYIRKAAAGDRTAAFSYMSRALPKTVQSTNLVNAASMPMLVDQTHQVLKNWEKLEKDGTVNLDSFLRAVQVLSFPLLLATQARQLGVKSFWSNQHLRTRAETLVKTASRQPGSGYLVRFFSNKKNRQDAIVLLKLLNRVA